jgi:hypothetical protein
MASDSFTQSTQQQQQTTTKGERKKETIIAAKTNPILIPQTITKPANPCLRQGIPQNL